MANYISVTPFKYRKRIFGCLIKKGMFFTKAHFSTSKSQQVYVCVDKLYYGKYTIIVAKPIHGRNKEIQFIDGGRFLYIQID